MMCLTTPIPSPQEKKPQLTLTMRLYQAMLLRKQSSLITLSIFNQTIYIFCFCCSLLTSISLISIFFFCIPQLLYFILHRTYHRYFNDISLWFFNPILNGKLWQIQSFNSRALTANFVTKKENTTGLTKPVYIWTYIIFFQNL